jgi:biopolymer transport protein TolR
MAGGGGHSRASRLSGKKKSRLDDVRADINITPLVDIILVLLIMFMVIGPLLARGLDVNLPKTEKHDSPEDDKQPIVAIDRDGLLFFDKEKLGDVNDTSIRRAVELIQRAWDSPDIKKGAGRVYVKVDASVGYGKVYPLLIAINELGVQTIELATHERKAK